ncbi:MAG: hypothetical protein ACYC18_14965 [Gammaproteobacteria bacterium]
MVTRSYRLPVALMLMLGAQLTLAFGIRSEVPQRDLLPPVPSARTLDAEAFGDPQFLFRIHSLTVQNAGETGGRIVPIKNYDFAVVVGWLRTLQYLDGRSIFPAAMADGYFGVSQNREDVRPIVKFLQENVALYPLQRWRFLYGAIFLAEHRLKDYTLALEAARQLASYEGLPISSWAFMTPAFVLDNMNEPKRARMVIEGLRQRHALDPQDDEWADKYLGYLARRESGVTPPPTSKFDN